MGYASSQSAIIKYYIKIYVHKTDKKIRKLQTGCCVYKKTNTGCCEYEKSNIGCCEYEKMAFLYFV